MTLVDNAKTSKQLSHQKSVYIHYFISVKAELQLSECILMYYFLKVFMLFTTPNWVAIIFSRQEVLPKLMPTKLTVRSSQQIAVSFGTDITHTPSTSKRSAIPLVNMIKYYGFSSKHGVWRLNVRGIVQLIILIAFTSDPGIDHCTC